ncbi:aryl-alcohol oxidase 2 [Datura stramonium]|uniref:Aryl-alcohol oxidase 2 n=1 Tax=Datura stramonium TaxID=4076 RepID=A0ABS8RT41_DATST|nr:aryl-alcohol oxidase 2 [Datura stramonium]
MFSELLTLTDVQIYYSGSLLNGISNIVEELPKSSNDGFISQGENKHYCLLLQVVESHQVLPNDIPSPPNCLHGAFIYSTKPLAGVKGIQLEPGQLTDGVTSIITFKDIPSGGANVADSQRLADVAARKAVVEYDTTNIDFPILTVEEAVEKSSFFQIPPYLYPKQVGDFSKGMAEADHKILADKISGSEYYFYMETQTALAIPDEDNCMVVYTQPSALRTRIVIASCLGFNTISVITRRVEVAWGQGNQSNASCALAAYKLRRPVRIYVNRNSDMIITGGRHPMKVTYSVGFKSSGKITALHLDILINAGITEDISPLLPSIMITALKNMIVPFFRCKTMQDAPYQQISYAGPWEVQGSYIAGSYNRARSGFTLDGDLVEKVRVIQADTLSIVQGGLTAGSTTSESSCEAVRLCCNDLVERLTLWKKQLEEQMALLIATDSPGGDRYSDRRDYHFGKPDIIYDCGQSLNPAVDMGQIEGLSYKESDFSCTKNILRTKKASGEPPLLLAASVHCATRAGVKAAREHSNYIWGKLDGSVSEFYLDVPAILPVVKTQCGLDYVEKYLETLLAQKSN